MYCCALMSGIGFLLYITFMFPVLTPSSHLLNSNSFSTITITQSKNPLSRASTSPSLRYISKPEAFLSTKHSYTSMDSQSRMPSPPACGSTGPKQLCPHRHDQKSYQKGASGNRNDNKSKTSVRKDLHCIAFYITLDLITDSLFPEKTPLNSTTKERTASLTELWYCCTCIHQGGCVGPFIKEMYPLCIVCNHERCNKCTGETTN